MRPDRGRIRELQSMVPEFVDRTRGSQWNRALPGGSMCVQAQPAGASPSRAGHCRWDSRSFSCGTSAQTSVGIWGSGRRSRQPLAVAHPAIRLCIIREPPPARPSRKCRQMFSGQVPENRRPWPLQSMAANGRRQNPRQQVEAGTARRPGDLGRCAVLRVMQPGCGRQRGQGSLRLLP